MTELSRLLHRATRPLNEVRRRQQLWLPVTGLKPRLREGLLEPQAVLEELTSVLSKTWTQSATTMLLREIEQLKLSEWRFTMTQRRRNRTSTELEPETWFRQQQSDEKSTFSDENSNWHTHNWVPLLKRTSLQPRNWLL